MEAGFVKVYFSTLWCSHTGDHPQEELAKFRKTD
jgi:hypothetical protein